MFPLPSKPAVPTPDMSVLNSLNNDELEVLVNDDDKFLSIMKDQVQENKADTEKQILLASTRSLAEFNLKREKVLTEGKQKLVDSTLEGEKLVQSIKEKISLIKENSGEKNPETVLALLQTAAAEQEETSEEIAAKFLDGELDVDAFLEQFHNCRKLMHMRRVKADKMSDILNKPHMERPSSPPPFTPPYSNPYGPMHHQAPMPLPYPTGPLNMPTPIGVPRY